MPGSGELNLFSVVALVLGGLAAVVLAIAVATRDSPPGRAAPSSANISPEPPPSATGQLPAAEVEYQLDTSEPSAEPRSR